MPVTLEADISPALRPHFLGFQRTDGIDAVGRFFYVRDKWTLMETPPDVSAAMPNAVRETKIGSILPRDLVVFWYPAYYTDPETQARNSVSDMLEDLRLSIYSCANDVIGYGTVQYENLGRCILRLLDKRPAAFVITSIRGSRMHCPSGVIMTLPAMADYFAGMVYLLPTLL